MLKKITLGICLIIANSVVAQELTDPTRPLTWSQAATEVNAAAVDMELSNIRYSERRRWAIINDRQVQVGDLVNGYRVTTIAPNKVELMNNEGERVELTLFGSLKKVVEEDGL